MRIKLTLSFMGVSAVSSALQLLTNCDNVSNLFLCTVNAETYHIFTVMYSAQSTIGAINFITLFSWTCYHLNAFNGLHIRRVNRQ
jgi:hypothetical protein